MSEELTEIFTDFLNAVEAAAVNAKRQIAELKGIAAHTAAVSEETFHTLKFEAQKGAKIGDYEVAYKPNNIEEKFQHAHNVLKNSNATIANRYYGEGYQFSYWLYGQGKIYRQKLQK
jgi:hypothetical protein